MGCKLQTLQTSFSGQTLRESRAVAPPHRIFRRKDPFYPWLVAIHGRGFIVQRSGPKIFAKYCHQSLGLQATFDAGPGNHFRDVPVHHLRQICRR